jgi:hypothetical protein
MSAPSLTDPAVLPGAARGPLGVVPDGRPEPRSLPATVEGLCAEFREVCQSAVDPLEIASALEFEGLSDQAARDIYHSADVFALARQMYAAVPRQPAEPEPPADPWQASRLRPALHGLLYGLPAVCFPAAAGLLAGPGVLASLVVALLTAWALSQGLAYLGYLRLGTADEAGTRRMLRAGLAAGLGLTGLAMTAAGLITHASPEVLAFGAGEGAYMLGACAAMVLAADRWLLLALAPGVAGGAAFLLLGRPPGLEHLTWAALAATPVLAVALAVVVTRRPDGQWPRAAELAAAAPAALFGLIAAGLLTFPLIAGPAGHGGVNPGALVAALPLSLSMGAAEWSLLWYRRRMRRLVRQTGELAEFGPAARRALLAAVAQYLAGAVALTAVAAWIALAAGLIRPDWMVLAELAAYLALGCAMFVGLTLQALGARAFALAACAVALAAELALWRAGVTVQLAACTGLLIALAGYAATELSRAVRHGY